MFGRKGISFWRGENRRGGRGLEWIVVLRRIGRMDGGRGGSQEMIDMDLGKSGGWNYMVMRDAIKRREELERNCVWRG